RLLLKAMDHGCCFTCGRDLTAHLASIANVTEEGCYGLFPEFWEFLDRDVMRSAVRTLRAIPPAEIRAIVESIPSAWDVSRAARDALADLILRRAAFVADHVEGWIWPQRELDFGPMEGETP